MAPPDSAQQSEQPIESVPLSFLEHLRIKLNSFVLRRLPLWDDIRDFGRWLEFEAVAVADSQNRTTIEIQLDSDATVKSLRIGPKPHNHQLDKHTRLWQFLSLLDIDRVILSARLERNQIEDILTFLYCRRRILSNRNSTANMRGTVANLLKTRGIHISCTDTSIQGTTLSITYSYCTLQFSHIVHWFERNNKKFSDHRTIFHAAPKYAVIIAVLAIGPSITYACLHSLWYLVMILSAGMAAAFITAVLKTTSTESKNSNNFSSPGAPWP